MRDAGIQRGDAAGEGAAEAAHSCGHATADSQRRDGRAGHAARVSARSQSSGATVRSVRQCSRPGCSEPATVTLTYQYGRALVWLDDLLTDRDPHAYDLCERHAARLSVPNGWRLEDRRPLRLVTISSRLAG